MTRTKDVLLSAWREACRHIEIAESTATIAATVAARSPLRFLVVRRLNLPHSFLETVAVAAEGPGADPGRGELSAAELKSIVEWGAERRVLRSVSPGDRALLALIGAGHVQEEVLAGPLFGPEELAGVLVGIAAPGAALDAGTAGLFEALLEPFAAALENDRRLHEMMTLREAAEADRRSLLTRLGRRDLHASIVGAELGLRPVMERVETVSRSDVPVLLLGETGTGKEVVARAIHERSPRHAGPFIRVNCGAIPSELIDSQLFGHERGSFTGAVAAHQGWFERADGGTLFLDEIGELPAAAQVRLLRVLQDGFFERVGGRRLIHVDVRIVAATHRDLAAMVRDGGFREDLWYRIAVFPILISPLRERLEDIPSLAFHFAEKAALRFGLPPVMPLPEDLQALAAYAWPGNVRELAAVIERAALIGNGRRLEIGTALGAGFAAPRTRVPSDAAPDVRVADSQPAPGAPPPASQSLDDAMRAHIESMLQACFGRVEGRFGAAAKLRIHPNTLRARMRRLGIDWKRYRA